MPDNADEEAASLEEITANWERLKANLVNDKLPIATRSAALEELVKARAPDIEGLCLKLGLIVGSFPKDGKEELRELFYILWEDAAALVELKWDQND